MFVCLILKHRDMRMQLPFEIYYTQFRPISVEVGSEKLRSSVDCNFPLPTNANGTKLGVVGGANVDLGLKMVFSSCLYS